MKAKEFVKKYHIDSSTHFDRDNFVEDMKYELVHLFNESYQSIHPVKRFERVVEDLKRKWDAIFNRSILSYEDAEKFWKFFYATEIINFRNLLFPDKEWKEYVHDYRYNNDPDFARRYDCWQMHEEMEDFEEKIRRAFYESLFNNIKKQFFNIVKELSIFDLTLETLSLESIQEKYRKLSKKYHPDLGGDEEAFKELTLAKDRLIEYISL